MIKVNVFSLAAERAGIPAELAGLDNDSLRNLQSLQKPTPLSLLNIEYWPENDITPAIDELTQKYGDEILTPDPANKIVNVSREVIALTDQEKTDIKKQRIHERIGEIKTEVQKLLNAFAQTRHYDDINSLCGFANSTNAKFAAEAARGIVVRDQTWTVLDAILSDVESSARVIPTVAEALSEVPPMSWV